MLVVVGDFKDRALDILRSTGRHPAGGGSQVDGIAACIHTDVVGGVIVVEVGAVDGGEIGTLAVQLQFQLVNGSVLSGDYPPIPLFPSFPQYLWH